MLRRILFFMVLVFTAVLSVSLSNFSAQAAPARPSNVQAVIKPLTSGTNCANIFSWNPPQICIKIYGTGTYVDSMTLTIDSGYATGYWRITGPSGFATRYTPDINVEGGKAVSVVFHAYLPKGKYCTSFRNDPNGSFGA